MSGRRGPKREQKETRAARPARDAVPARPRGTLSRGWVAVLLALLVMAFFHEVVVGGKTFVSPDATAPAGFVRIGEASLYGKHVYPLWNPLVFLGMPSFASGTYNPLIYPPDWPLALLQKVLPLPELTWMLLYYFLGGLFMFLLALEWGARPEGALIGAVGFVFAPNLVAIGAHGHGSQLVDSSYLPLLLWLATRWMRRGGPANLGWLALAGGFQLLRGHVQVCYYTWIAVMLYVAVEWIASLRAPGTLARTSARAAGVVGAAVLAFGIAGFYNLPLREYAQYSIRGGGADGGVGFGYATQWSLSPWELPAIVVPGWAGFGGATYWGGMPFTDYPNAYVGMVAALLLVPAFLANGRVRVFALVLGIGALLVAFGYHTPVYALLYAYLPLFNKFRVPVMVVLLFQVAVALGVAWGWSAVLGAAGRGASGRDAEAGASRRIDRVIAGAAVALAVGLIAGVVGKGLWRGAYVALATGIGSRGGGSYTPDLAGLAFEGFDADLIRACAIGLAVLAVAWMTRRGRLAVSIGSAIVLLLMLVELWPVSGRVMLPVLGNPAQRDLSIGRDDVTDFLEKAGPPGSFRILPFREFQSNRFAGFGIASVGGYHAAKPRLFQDFLDARLQDNPSWLRLLNVRYLVIDQRLDPPPPWLQEVHAGSAYVYENLLALPRVTVVGRYRVVTPARAILDSVAAGTEDSATMTWLEQDPHLELGPVEGAHASIVSYGLNEVVVDVDTPGPALLRLADLWYPAWTVSVDGRPAKLLKADYLLRAVAVPAGQHRVTFAYRSPAMRRGLMLSGASLLVCLLLLGAGWWRRRPRPEPPASEPVAEAA